MQLDLSQPLMTEDGRPVTLVRPAKTTSAIIVTYAGPYDKRHLDRDLQKQDFHALHGGVFYNLKGQFCGGHPDSNYRIMNAFDPADSIPEDWS